MEASWIDEAGAEELRQTAREGFATAKAVGQTLALVLWRDEDAAPPAGSLSPQLVLLIVGEGGTMRQGDAAQIITNTGEFRKEPPFDVRVGDRFTLPAVHPSLAGVTGYINEPPIDRGPYISAPFRLEG